MIDALTLIYWATIGIPVLLIGALVNSLLVTLGFKMVVPTGPPVWRKRWRPPWKR